VIDSGKASTSLLQRRLGIGYGRAAKLIDIMEEQGIVGSATGNKPRDVLVSSIDDVFGGGPIDAPEEDFVPEESDRDEYLNR
jgi:S-DNA-T family DNA segregation ATPase FtsK/SpoIIIE